MRPRVVMVGPGPDSAGGVWSVMSTVLGSALADRYVVTAVATHRDGNPLRKGGEGLRGLGRVAAMLARRHPPDLIWLHTASGFSFRRKAIAALMAHLRGVPYIVHVHGAELHLWYRSITPPERALVRWVLRSAHTVVCLSPIWERRVHQITPCRTAAVMNPVQVPTQPAPRPAGGPLRIVSTGRLGDRKGSRVLVRALALLSERGHRVELHLAGDGDQRPVREEAAARGVADRLFLHGWLNAVQVDRLLADGHVFALPSRDEGVPVSLLEAMARAMPVVVTPVGGIPDLVRDGVDGLIVPPDDQAALAAAMERLIGDPSWAARLGVSAHQTVLREAATEVFVERIGHVVDRAIGGGPTAVGAQAPTG